MSKLIRDKIPELIKLRGEIPLIHIASEKEYKEKLFKKLSEETDEFLQDENEEELADVFEVIYAICAYKKFSLPNIEKIRKNKLLERGGFKKRIILDR